MNNMERIAVARLANNIPEDMIVESFAEWNRRGMKIKRGETAVFRIQIWVPKPNKSEDEEETVDTNMNLWWTNFFTEEQVEPMPADFKKKRRKKKST